LIDKTKILTRNNLPKNKGNKGNDSFVESYKRNFGARDLKKTFEGVENTDIGFEEVKEFEFDGFSVVVENGEFAVKYEDSEEGLVIQYLADENEKIPIFPYLFEMDGVEKILTEENYLKIKAFLEKDE